MKKSLIALAALAAASASFAQSSVTLSGSINVGVMDTGAAGAKAVASHLGNGANAININSTEDLGGGLKGGFTGQIRYNAVTGDVNSSGAVQNDQLLHAANAYIGGGFGTVRVGKIAEAGSCAFDPWGCTSGAGLMAGSAGGVSALVGAGTQANSVSYATPTIAGFSGGFQTTVSTRTNERQVLNFGYANGPLSLAFVQAKNGNNTIGPSPSAAATAVFADIKLTQTFVGASYDLGVAKVGVFNSKSENAAGTTTADATGVTATAPMGAVTLLAGYVKDKKKAANADTRTAFGVNYALSKRTTLGADVFKAEAGAGTGTGFTVRVGHTF